MIFSILFLFLLVVIIALCLYFLFQVFLPSLTAQKINAVDPIFSKEEVDDAIRNGDFRQAETGLKAFVFNSEENCVPDIQDYKEESRDCALFVYSNNLGDNKSWNCVGLGNCIRFCPRNAIEIRNGTAIIEDECNGCGLCVEICPLNLIKLLPADSDVLKKEKNHINLLINKEKGFKFWQK